MRLCNKAVVLLLFLLICGSVFGAMAEAKLSAVALNSETSRSSLLGDESDYKPVTPPKPRTVKGEKDPTAMAGFNVLTREEVMVPSTDPSQSPTEVDATSTPPYEGRLSTDLSPETVFPPDDRTSIQYGDTAAYPYRTICKLYVTAADGTKYMGSGAIIDRYHVLTAGHMVYMADHGGWIVAMQVIPGYDGLQGRLYQQMPYYNASATYLRSYTGWTVYQDHQHDFAVCTLDRCVGDYTGWMGRMTMAASDPKYTGVLNTAGYPGDKDSGKRMYYDSDYGRTANEYNHWYYMDTYGGQSGSPVWYYDGTNRYIVTVHAYSDDGTGSNHGTRLNQEKFNSITTWLSADTPPTDKADLTDDGQTWSGFSPTTVVAGVTSFNVWCDVRNFGTAASGGFYVAYYASTDTIISPADNLIGTVYVSSISPFAYANSDWTGIFPSSIPSGTRYVGWIIDSTGTVPEFNEGNNIAYKNSYQLTVGGAALDLSASPPAQTVAAGGSTMHRVVVTLISGSPGTVSLSLNLPSNVGTYTFTPMSATPTFTSTLVITTISTALAGTYNMNITATSSAGTFKTPITLVVTAAPSLTLNLSPQPVARGAPLTISGQLTPGQAATIRLYYRYPHQTGTWNLATLLNTNAVGAYNVVATVPYSLPVGQYDLIAVWFNEARGTYVASPVTLFTVI